jgi:hypothetical protein
VYIAGVHQNIWQHAKRKAVASNLPFREYVIRLLEKSTSLIAETLSRDQKRT